MRARLRNFLLKNTHNFVSPWVVLTIDLLLVMLAFVVAYQLRFNFTLSTAKVHAMFHQMAVYAGFCLVFFLLFKNHRGIIRHTSMHDIWHVFAATTLSIGALWAVCNIGQIFINYRGLSVPLSVLLIAYMTTMLFLLLFRFFIKVTYLTLTRNRIHLENILIFGAGEMGIATLNTILITAKSPYRVVGFVDDNPGKWDKIIGGIRVFAPQRVNHDFISTKNIHQIILAVQNLPDKRRKEVIDKGLELGLKVTTVPGFKHWKEGRLSMKQIRRVRIEELLQRPAITLENGLVCEQIKDKVVLVTGAAGSIGSELAHQIMKRQPARLILLDQAETPLFELEQELNANASKNGTFIHYLLGDVSLEKNLRQVFETYRPQIIYHAAAYKHVPIVEHNPLEALRVNVFGTRNAALLAFEYHAESFVLVSTDKAVNPTSFMGASKRLAEIYIQSLGQFTQTGTRFITTRFGNVLGSNGSVIPIFEKQIAAGGPVTVTHPEMTRFFMTIPEACSLVLEASVMGQGGEIFVFDMGQQIRIADVAQKMIKLSGLEPGTDIDIVYTGLRPGEKMYEELFNDYELNQPTHHPRIMIARVKPQDFHTVSERLDQIERMVGKRDMRHIMWVIGQMVPEYCGKTEHVVLPPSTATSIDPPFS